MLKSLRKHSFLIEDVEEGSRRDLRPIAFSKSRKRAENPNTSENLPFPGRKEEFAPTIRPSGLCRFLHSDHRLPGRFGRAGRHNLKLGIMNIMPTSA